MLNKVIGRLFGTRHERERKRVQPIINEIASIEERLATLPDSDIQAQTAKFRAMLAQRVGPIEARIAELKAAKRVAADAAERERLDNELHGVDGRGGVEGELRTGIATILDEILPEAFATVREACRRLVGTTVIVTGRELKWNMVPYDVQLMGGIQLHLGRIAEMATGEGKTLVATLPLYLNALPGTRRAPRDGELVPRPPRLAVDGAPVHATSASPSAASTTPSRARRSAAPRTSRTSRTARTTSSASTTCATTWSTSLDQRVQRQHVFAIVDEVDSVLIDEARTPLIISGPVGNEGDVQYFEHNAAVVAPRAQADGARERARRRRRARARSGRTTSDAALKLYQAQLGHPKNRRLLKLLQEPGDKQLVQKMELEHIADRKLPPAKQPFRDIEEDLLFVLDEKGHSVHLTDRGVDFMSPADHDAFVLPDISARPCTGSTTITSSRAEEKIAARRDLEIEYAAKSERLNIVHQLLRAHALYEKDVNYVVQDGEVLIVDEFTGRTMPGRRW